MKKMSKIVVEMSNNLVTLSTYDEDGELVVTEQIDQGRVAVLFAFPGYINLSVHNTADIYLAVEPTDEDIGSAN